MPKRPPQPEANGDRIAAPVDIPTSQLSPPDSQTPPDAEREETGNPPAHVVRFGPVRACVWRNDDGERAWYQVTVNRLYKGQDGQWHSTDSFGYAHLLPLAKSLDSAHSWVAAQLANNDVPF